MKRTLQVGAILAALALSVVGCDPAEPKVEEKPKHEELAGSKLGPPSPAPPVNPSSTPTIPADAKREMLPEEKNYQANPESKKEEPKSETPK